VPDAIRHVALRGLLDRRTYGRILYLLLALPLGTGYFCFLLAALFMGLGMAITLVGIPILVATVYAWRWLAGFERLLAARLLGVEIPTPYRPDAGDSWWARWRSRLADPATWKDLVFLFVQFPLGIVSSSATLALLGASGAALTAPAWYWAVPGGIDALGFRADTLAEALLLVPIGAALGLLSLWVLNGLGALHGAFASLMLGSSADPEVVELRGARARMMAAADAERRRLERDLHDGAQQRLVSLALTLRMARDRAGNGGPEAELLERASEEAAEALAELRDLARGIHPAILTNRGLDAALADLAARAPLPVEVVATPGERLPEPVEATAYFVASEALANVAKHAGAGAASVSARLEEAGLVVEVGDDGAGGAGLGRGSGLQGLEDRVTALDGRLSIESPPGGGTMVRAVFPRPRELAPEPAAHESREPAFVRVLGERGAELLRARRRRGLLVHAGVLAAAGAVLAIVWAGTGAGYFWPAWPLLYLGSAFLFHLWLALGRRPVTEADVAAHGGDPVAAAYALARARGFASRAVACGVLEALLVGVWALGGGGYLWPVWPLAGLAALLAADAAITFGRPRRRSRARTPRGVAEA
jgi:signal transduction histidine kinase